MTVNALKKSAIASVAIPLVVVLAIVAGYVWYFGFSGLVPVVGSMHEAGYVQGLLNGIFAVPTLLVSLFNDSWVAYAPVNSGNGYAAGFLFGLVLAFWGARPPRRKR